MFLQRGRYKIVEYYYEVEGFAAFQSYDYILGFSLWGEALPLDSLALWFELKRTILLRSSLPDTFFPPVKSFFLEQGRLFFLYSNVPEYNLIGLKAHHAHSDYAQIANNICQALSILQKNNLVHGNLRPENIFIDKKDHVQLLALSLKGLEQNTGIFWPAAKAFTAPEIQKNIYTANTNSDIYALGSVIAFLLSEKSNPDTESISLLPIKQRELIRKCRATAVSERHTEFQNIIADINNADLNNSMPEKDTSTLNIGMPLHKPKPMTKPVAKPTKIADKASAITDKAAVIQQIPLETADMPITEKNNDIDSLIDRLSLALKKNQSQRLITLLIEISKYPQNIKPQAIDYIRSLLGQSPDFFVLATVVKTIGKISTEDEWQNLSRFLKHSDSRVAANAVEALSNQENTRLIGFLESLLYEETLLNEGRTRVLCTGIPFLKKYRPESAIEAMRLLSNGDQEAVSSYAFLICNWDKAEPLLHKYTMQLLKKEIRLEVATASLSYIEKYYDDDCLRRLLMLVGTLSDSPKKKLITDFLDKIGYK